MKKLFLFLTAAMLLSAASAQETIRTTTPPDNYYYEVWPTYQPNEDSMICDNPIFYPSLHYKGIVMNTKDTITIYGLAFGARVRYADPCHTNEGPVGYYDSDSVWHLVGDSSLRETYMDFYIMQEHANVYPVSDTVRLHMEYDTVAYFVDQAFMSFQPWYKCQVIPVYEMYFRNPSTVVETFYIGGINHSAEYCLPSHQKYPMIRGVSWGKIGGNDLELTYVDQIDGVWDKSTEQPWQWFFPILTPNPNPDTTTYIPPDDTTHVPGDSTQTSIRTNTWERYVSLQPNPTSDEATVLSSFGIDEVEVFDMAGSRVLLQQASGLAAKLDVKALPRGSYIVRIHTPMGTTSRKLVVQ